jgi:hypothetical protein
VRTTLEARPVSTIGRIDCSKSVRSAAVNRIARIRDFHHVSYVMAEVAGNLLINNDF